MTDERAPHGYEEDGTTPKAPYGLKVDGTPRKSNRGATAGSRGNTTQKKATPTRKSATDVQRKSMFVDMMSNFVEMPLIAASASPPVVSKIGDKHADALAADAFIIHQFAPHLFDGMNVLSQSKPKVLSWMDTVEENAPYLQLAMVGIQMAKAFIGNHMNPDPRMAEAGRTMVQMAAAEMAEEVERRARAAGMTMDMGGAPQFADEPEMANA